MKVRIILEGKNKFKLKARKPNMRLYRLPYQVSGILWIFHRHDDDPFPSVPHGDSVYPQGKYKLDISSGKIYLASSHAFYKNADKKDMDRLKHDDELRDLALYARRYYKEKHPQIPLEPIPWINETRKARLSSISIRDLVYNIRVEE
jgi:hypothetical protein